VKKIKIPVPKVLLQAKKQALQGSAKSGSWDKGPWDKGHWANRK